MTGRSQAWDPRTHLPSYDLPYASVVLAQPSLIPFPYTSPSPDFLPFMTLGQTQLERAIYEIQHRAEVPELDFTQHQLDNGYTISTRERVVKDVLFRCFSLVIRGVDAIRLGWDRCKHPL
jgi:hypothetical protein